jgi:uncharacterized Zn finger protein (UPF0148 family)
MLPYHCPDCGIPIFKYEERMICPSCGKEAIFESELDKKLDKKQETGSELTAGVGRGVEREVEGVRKGVVEDTESGVKRELEKDDAHLELGGIGIIGVESSKRSKHSEPSEFSEFSESSTTRARLRIVLEAKLDDISDLLAKTESPREIEKLLDLLERIFSLLKRLEEK